MPPIGALLPGARSSTLLDLLAGKLRRCAPASGDSFASFCFLRRRRRRFDAIGHRLAELARQFARRARRDRARCAR